jgi:D-glycero-D-manno-heptose 1,7-bisphosphate phosphatase
MFPALFLDRDGVIIENRSNYVRSWADVEIFPQALQALSLIKSTPYKIVIVTNQSAVGRGLVDIQSVHQINTRLAHAVEKAGGRIDGIFICPHAPQDNCNCRKPLPGLLHQAVKLLNLDLSRSILVGDALSDLEAGHAAGVSQLALVRTGRGIEQIPLIRASTLDKYSIFEDLSHAVRCLVLS